MKTKTSMLKRADFVIHFETLSFSFSYIHTKKFTNSRTMVLSTLVLAFISFLTTSFAVSADNAGVAITNPVINSTVPAGSNLTIEWTVLDQNASDIKFIRLMDGDALALNTVIPNILDNNTTIPVNATRYIWAVPANLTAREDYVISMLGDGPFATYSGYFSIVASTENTTAASTAATTNDFDSTR